MADVKITDLTALGAAAASGDLLEVTDISGPDVSRKATVAEIVNKTVMQAAGAAFDTDFSSANSILLATTANTPAVLAFAASTLLGRGASGNAGALTKAQVLTLLNVADGANNYSHPNHTGDVTSTGDGATVITANAVTLAMMATMATASFIGRNTGGTGDPEILSAATARTILNVADGANNYVHPNHSGDVTSVADGAQTIVAGAVTLAKMANMATDSMLGRDTVGSGAPEVLTPAAVRAILNVADGANNYSHPNHTGDVTSTGDGATVIANSAVTLAKMADMATASLLGRNTTSTGVPEVLSKATALSLLNVEDGATADQSGAEIKTAYEANADTNEFSDAEQTKLAGIETSADVTDAANVDAAGAVMETDYNAETILIATADNTPLPVTVAASTLVGRKASGSVGTMSTAEARTLLNVEDNSDNSKGVHSIWAPAGFIRTRASNGASVGSVEMPTNKNMIESLDFDTAADEFAQFSIRMPKSWDEGTVTFIPVWSHASTTTNFGVSWWLQAVAVSNDDAHDVAFGTAQESQDTGGKTDDSYQGPESSAITIGGSPAEGDLVNFQIYRDVSDAGDTMAIDARLHGVLVFYTTNAGTDA